MERATFAEVEAALPYFIKRAERHSIAIERHGQVCIVMLPIEDYKRLLGLEESAALPEESKTPEADA